MFCSNREAPIQKCTGRTYYAYYLKEQNKGSTDFVSQVFCFRMEVFAATSTHEAPAKLAVSNDNFIAGTLWMDESYAYATFHEPGKDLFWGLTFFYHRQRDRKKYAGEWLCYKPRTTTFCQSASIVSCLVIPFP